MTVEEQKRNRGSSKMQDFNHTREDIFALPSMQLHLKTEHLQTAQTPDGTGKMMSSTKQKHNIGLLCVRRSFVLRKGIFRYFLFPM